MAAAYEVRIAKHARVTPPGETSIVYFGVEIAHGGHAPWIIVKCVFDD
jgi:hypothetical protein